jgi:hypothetical protein
VRALERAVDLREHVEHAAQVLRGDADAGVADADDRVAVLDARRYVNVSIGVRVLAGIVQDICEHLGEPHAVAVHHDRPCRQRGLDVLIRARHERATGFDRLLDHRREVDALHAQVDATATDAADVDQVVDQPHELRELTLHGRPAALDHVAIALSPLYQFERVAQRRERSAQLVRERRQELVLAPVGLDQRGLRLLAERNIGDAEEDAVTRVVRRWRQHHREVDVETSTAQRAQPRFALVVLLTFSDCDELGDQRSSRFRKEDLREGIEQLGFVLRLEKTDRCRVDVGDADQTDQSLELRRMVVEPARQVRDAALPERDQLVADSAEILFPE